MAARKQTSGMLPFIITVVVVGVVALVIWKAAGARRPVGPVPVPVAPVVERPQPAPEEDRVILTPEMRAIPGMVPTMQIRFRHPTASRVAVAGTWDYWSAQHPMEKRDGVWTLDVTPLGLSVGRYQFKFVSDGQWEAGDNRILYVNLEGKLERPDDVIFSARVEASNRVDVLFRHDVTAAPGLEARIVPELPIARLRWREPRGTARMAGFSMGGEFVTFFMDERIYDLALGPTETVTVAGDFNNWRSDGAGGTWQLRDDDDDGLWQVTVRMDGLSMATDGGLQLFKFVVNGQRWLRPPETAPNARSDGKGNLNLELDARLSSARTLEIYTEGPIDLSQAYMLVLEGLGKGTAMREISPGGVLDAIRSTRPMGAQLDRARGSTTFRVFAPRARSVELHLYDGPQNRAEDGSVLPSREMFPMRFYADGAWDVTVPRLLAGQYYAFRVEGPTGAGEGFNPNARVADPYALSMAHSHNNSIVVDTAATNAWFPGWTDGAHRVPALADLVIYEAHVRDLTIDASSGVPEHLRGKYAGLAASLGTGTGLGHLKQMGINAIELMPTAEFWNGVDRYDWGYGPGFYFSPEASFAQDPLRGSQFYEFKRMVDDLHREGFAVILDVVYNHIGGDDVFTLLDRKYYFRQDQDYNLQNFSGCGNDLRTEAPMLRRLIVDNILYWMREHHVDGFRFDLADLIDMETLMAVRDAARAENPDIILISEPWSFRGDHRAKLKGKGWAAWNGDFRYAGWDFARGHGNRDSLRALVRGSVDLWTATPAQAINYLESHDDKALADELTTNAGGDGRNLTELDAARNRLAATFLFTSLGTPMINAGQEWIRSKRGWKNTFDRGDEGNALRWGERERPEAATTMAYYRGLIRLRRSPAGQTLRWQREVPGNYIQWIEPSDGRALGYVMNGERTYPGAGFVVLLNGADREMDFEVPFPPGNWRLVGDGRKMDAQGFSWQAVSESGDGHKTVRVPPVTGYVFVGM